MELDGLDQKLDIKTVVHVFKNMCYNNKQYVRSNFLLTDGNEVWSVLNSGSYFKHEVWSSMGTGGLFANGYLNENVKENLSYAETK